LRLRRAQDRLPSPHRSVGALAAGLEGLEFVEGLG